MNDRRTVEMEEIFSGEIRSYTVGPEIAGQRLDRYLSDREPEISRSYLQKLIREGNVLLDGKPAKAGAKLSCGAEIELMLPEAKEPEILPEKLPLDILYEDSDVILINKPKGMVVHPSAGHYTGTLVNGLLCHCRGELSGINGVGKTTILNRSVNYLEQTSGEVKSDEKNGVHVYFDNPAATFIPYDVIRSYDRPLIMGDFTARMADANVKSELDWQLYLLQRRYLDYQVNIGNKMIELLSGDEEQRSLAPSLSLPKRKFQDMIDELSAIPIRR